MGAQKGRPYAELPPHSAPPSKVPWRFKGAKRKAARSRELEEQSPRAASGHQAGGSKVKPALAAWAKHLVFLTLLRGLDRLTKSSSDHGFQFRQKWHDHTSPQNTGPHKVCRSKKMGCQRIQDTDEHFLPQSPA